ncbi:MULTISPECIES: DUF4181 domain-containing protein [Rossellomorea]|uniref:DUF4181 domain-containing protein n=1 Tax=Rossellomorea TaxID=2837508 RepID=UPI001CCFE4CB|nr:MULTISPECIES: DUF4181 domain-containing protein [Rossellomorea]MCA0149511.1 DUF4181 domain-containing protein [Rossellomorea vietnamensis]WGG46687.1 DUF4181 domain-containing protein [Rossellomorea sp. DA94]
MIFYVSEKTVRKKWNIVRRPEAEEVNTLHKWGKRILWIIFFVNVVFFPAGIKNMLIIMVIFLFNACMQWKSGEKEYIITLLGLVIFIVFISLGYTFDIFSE